MNTGNAEKSNTVLLETRQAIRNLLQQIETKVEVIDDTSVLQRVLTLQVQALASIDSLCTTTNSGNINPFPPLEKFPPAKKQKYSSPSNRLLVALEGKSRANNWGTVGELLNEYWEYVLANLIINLLTDILVWMPRSTIIFGSSCKRRWWTRKYEIMDHLHVVSKLLPYSSHLKSTST